MWVGIGILHDPRDFGTFLTWVGALPAPAEFWVAPDLAPGRRVIANTWCAIAGSFGLRKAASGSGG